MKIIQIISACNNHANYCGFIPLFCDVWKCIFPEIKITILFIADKIPHTLKKYDDHLILIKPKIETQAYTAFVSQNIRMLWPCLNSVGIEGECEGGAILITDIDMIPLNRDYYTRPLKNIDDDEFVIFRDIIRRNKEYPICYNAASRKTWQSIFGELESKEDVQQLLVQWYSNIKYDGKHGGGGWNHDQKKLFAAVEKSKRNGAIKVKTLNDKLCKFNRLKKTVLKKSGRLNNSQVRNIKNKAYSDCHLPGPPAKFNTLLNEIRKAIISTTR